MTISDLIIAHQKGMLRFALRLTRNPTAAEDVFQSACVSALQSRTPAEDIENPAAWLNLQVRSAMAKRHRSERRYVPGGEAIVARRTMDGGQLHAAELADVERAIDAMPAGRRDAFRLVAVEGMGCDEAGAVLGISRQAVSVQCRRARAELLAA